MFPFFNHYPGSDLHEIDLAYILKLCAELQASNTTLTVWKATHEQEYEELANKVEGLINNLVDVIVPWDSSIAYHIFSIVEYQGTNYIAVQDVPIGAMITNTDYWQPANTVIEQINAIGLVTSDISDKVDAIPNEIYPRRVYFRPETYGAIVDDNTVDNAPFIKTAIDAAIAENGIVLLSEGVYYTSTPINITDRAMCIRIVGTGGHTPVNSNYGTVIEYSGTGFAIHFSNGIWGAELKDFSIRCTGAGGSGIKFSHESDIVNKYRSTRSRMTGIDIYFRSHGIDLLNGAYFWIEDCNIHANNNYTDTGRRALVIGDDTESGNYNEYISLVNVALVCEKVSAASLLPSFDSVGIYQYEGTHVYMYDVDVTDSDIGYLIAPSADCGFMQINNLDLARCRYGVNIKIAGISVQNTEFNQLVYTPPADVNAADRGLKVDYVSGSTNYNAKIKIHDFTVRTGTATMTYLAEADDYMLAPGDSEITFSMPAVPKVNYNNNYRIKPNFSTLAYLSASAEDLNDFKNVGMVPHEFTAAAANGPGFNCMVIVFGSYTHILQIAIPMVSTSSVAFRVYNISGGNWGAWQTLAKE